MHFPKDRIRFSETFQGKDTPAGYLTLNLRGLDLEGINELWVDLSLAEELRKKKGQQDRAAEDFKALFGKEEST